MIERTISRLTRYRRLTIRYERKANHFLAFLTLTATNNRARNSEHHDPRLEY